MIRLYDELRIGTPLRWNLPLYSNTNMFSIQIVAAVRKRKNSVKKKKFIGDSIL